MFKMRAAAGLAVVVLVTSGCASEGLAFVQDQRLEIHSPKDHTEVSLPVTIDWTIEDFDVTGLDGNSSTDAGLFGVFVDEAPIPPGKHLSWVAHNDRICTNTEGCPDEQYLADRGVHTTTETSFTLKQLPDLDIFEGYELHEVTVVLLDGTGHRLQESAWHVTLLYDRQEQEG